MSIGEKKEEERERERKQHVYPNQTPKNRDGNNISEKEKRKIDCIRCYTFQWVMVEREKISITTGRCAFVCESVFFENKETLCKVFFG